MIFFLKKVKGFSAESELSRDQVVTFFRPQELFYGVFSLLFFPFTFIVHTEFLFDFWFAEKN